MTKLVLRGLLVCDPIGLRNLSRVFVTWTYLSFRLPLEHVTKLHWRWVASSNTSPPPRPRKACFSGATHWTQWYGRFIIRLFATRRLIWTQDIDPGHSCIVQSYVSRSRLDLSQQVLLELPIHLCVATRFSQILSSRGPETSLSTWEEQIPFCMHTTRTQFSLHPT